jgi:hypothetical protein
MRSKIEYVIFSGLAVLFLALALFFFVRDGFPPFPAG